MKIFIRIDTWEIHKDKVSVKYFTWDGICLCTKEFHTSIIDKPQGDIDKRSLTLELLKQIYKQ